MAGEGKRPSPRHWILLGAVVLLALAVVLPPLVSIGRYQHRIAASVSRSIGQPVHMSSVKLQLLPRPGFELTDFVVEEKPGFGAEPILRCASVVASLRLLSLWRGELEIARIDFDEASLNLVRAADGSWNFGSILVQAAHTPNAPTGQRYASAARRFPYIEATDSRINFKQGDEKKPLSFLNADLSVWLENPDEWGVHFRAQPVRTDLDLDLSDTGVLHIDGTLRRAAALGEMPVNLKAKWTNAPLGQLSRLTIGRDIGWRGALDVQAEVRGTADLTRIRTLLKVSGLHRSEFAPAQPLDIQTLCEASYSKQSASLEGIACASSVGSGELRLTGYLRNSQTKPQADLDLDIHRVPTSAVLTALQGVRNGLGDLHVSGTVNGHFRYLSPGVSEALINAVPPRTPAKRGHPKLHAAAHPSAHPGEPSPGAEPALSGEMRVSSLTLAPAGSERPFTLSGVRLVMESQNAATSDASPTAAATTPIAQPALLLQPVRLGLGAPAPITVDGRFTLAGFDFHLRGPGTLDRLRLLSHALGLLNASTGRLSPAAILPGTSTASGDLTLDVNIRGPWLLPIPDAEHPLASSTTLGSIAIKDAEVSTSYLSQPLRIASAQAILGPNEISWTNASISYGNLNAQGTLEYPTVCTPSPPCPAQFQLIASTLDVGELQSTLFGVNQSESGELLREILGSIERHPVLWPRLSGTIQVGALSSGKLVLHDATGALEIGGHSITVRSLNGGLLNGAMHLAGTLDAAEDQPKYEFDVQVANASPSALAALFGEQWGGGLLNLSAQWKMSGIAPSELAQSASGSLHWDWTRGSLATDNPLPTAAQPLLHFDDWTGDAAIGNSSINIKQSLLARGLEVIPLSGTISFDRQLALKSEPESPGFSVTGTLEHPTVKPPAAEAEAHAAPLHAVVR
jgi:AsmA family/AsmA-like C-terminal region